MIRAVLFDFNGVIVDDEPVHLRLFQKVLQEEGVLLNREDYYSKYLGMDDHDCFAAAARDAGRPKSDAEIQSMISRKSRYYDEAMATSAPFVPGVLELIRALASHYYLAVVSGALRHEIEMMLERGKVREAFNVIVAAEDIQRGKPDPEGFDKAMQLLNRDFVASADLLLPAECLVFEDSIWGLQAAAALGMPSVAVTTSFSESALPGARFYIQDFTGLAPEQLLRKIG
ncbi:MAG TPA: HAD family phosphatase [Deltaproteobacteria bacterium]|nr:HAD family phosphatase [Deltaproteobacteria bacterium]